MEAGQNSLRLQNEVQGLRDLLHVAKVVVSSLDMEGVLQSILTSAMELVQVPAGSIALVEETGELVLKAHQGLSSDFVSEERWTPKEGGLTEQVLQQREVLVLSDTAPIPFFNNPLAMEENIRSLVAVPLLMEQECIGVLYLDDFVPRQFEASRLDLLPLFASFAAISIEKARTHARIRKTALLDGLTGLYNYRHFKNLFDAELSRSERLGSSLSLLKIDVHDFKTFNHQYGQAAGDKALVAISDILRRHLRKVDVCCRCEGEKFLLYLPETGQGNARSVAARIRGEIVAHAGRHLGETANGSIIASIGVATYPQDGRKMEFLLKVVSDLLIIAKKRHDTGVAFLSS